MIYHAGLFKWMQLPEPTLPTTATNCVFSTLMFMLDSIASLPLHENEPFSITSADPITTFWLNFLRITHVKYDTNVRFHRVEHYPYPTPRYSRIC